MMDVCEEQAVVFDGQPSSEYDCYTTGNAAPSNSGKSINSEYLQDDQTDIRSSIYESNDPVSRQAFQVG